MPPLIAATPLTSVAASPAIVATTSSANNTLPYSSPVGKCILSVKKPTSSEIFNNAYIIPNKSYICKRFYILGIIFILRFLSRYPEHNFKHPRGFFRHQFRSVHAAIHFLPIPHRCVRYKHLKYKRCETYSCFRTFCKPAAYITIFYRL